MIRFSVDRPVHLPHISDSSDRIAPPTAVSLCDADPHLHARNHDGSPIKTSRLNRRFLWTAWQLILTAALFEIGGTTLRSPVLSHKLTPYSHVRHS